MKSLMPPGIGELLSLLFFCKDSFDSKYTRARAYIHIYACVSELYKYVDGHQDYMEEQVELIKY